MSVKAEHELKAPAKEPLTKQQIKENLWAIRPCFMYKEEYDDCTSIRGRFQQYFVHGNSADCSQWQRDYDNCVHFEKSPDNLQAAQEIFDSESNRRAIRWKGHYGNTVWEKRKSPPEDWAKPLPEWLLKRNENSYLDIKSKEIDSGVDSSKDRTLCVVM